MDAPTDARTGWQWYALGSAGFAALTALLAKVGVAEINSNLASMIRTVIILLLTVGIVAFRAEWEPLQKLSIRGVTMLVLSDWRQGFPGSVTFAHYRWPRLPALLPLISSVSPWSSCSRWFAWANH